VDVQLRGPYTLWHHTHTFEERCGGTLCLDDVRYRPRGGALTNWLFVRRDVKSIFAFRSERLAQMFPISVAEMRGATEGIGGGTINRQSVADHPDVAH
jgi:ligand-binding SRPBCC domain-containing protein